MGLLDEHGGEAMLTLWETGGGQIFPNLESVQRMCLPTNFLTIFYFNYYFRDKYLQYCIVLFKIFQLTVVYVTV